MKTHNNPDVTKLPAAPAALAQVSGSAAELLARIQNYLGNGGLWNPEAMEHDKVRNLIMDFRTYLNLTSPADTEPNGIKQVLMFQSATSGLWYYNYHAAGDISAVKLKGELYVKQRPRSGTGRRKERTLNMAMGIAKPRVWPEDKATRDWLRDQQKKRRQAKAATKREGQGPLPASTCSVAGEKCNWRIEYEIPPLRAIYMAEAGPCTEAEAREQVKTEQPLWRIRKMEPQNS